jgi:DNA-binding winged helix-turn-helix (wHTH) protein
MRPLQIARTRTPYSVIADVAERHGVTVAELRAKVRQPAVDRARVFAYRALRDEMGWKPPKIAQYFGRSKQAVDKCLKRTRLVDVSQAYGSAEEMADLLLRRINYLSGQSILYEVARKLDLKTQDAITLSILIRNAPRPLTLGAISELYDHAWQGINAQEKAICETTVKSSVSHIRKHMSERGLPNPIDTVKPAGYVLNARFALWARENMSIRALV